MAHDDLLDSGAWFSLFISTDPDHRVASTWFAANSEPLITTDYIVDETLTLLRARGQSLKALEVGALFFAGKLDKLHYLTARDIAAAWAVFRTFADKDWSFTDCTCKVVMEFLGITTAFSFDRHFHQFGSVVVVPFGGRLAKSGNQDASH